MGDLKSIMLTFGSPSFLYPFSTLHPCYQSKLFIPPYIKPQILRLIIRKTVYLQKTMMPMYIHEHKEWPSFSWNKELVGEKLSKVNKAVGYLMGRLSVIGFNDKMSAVVESISHDIIASRS